MPVNLISEEFREKISKPQNTVEANGCIRRRKVHNVSESFTAAANPKSQLNLDFL